MDYTITEAGDWIREAEGLLDRSTSPWDLPTRRPSHADERRARLDEEIREVLRPGVGEAEIQAAAERLFSPAA